MSRAFLLAASAVAAAVIVAIVLSTTGAPATENASSTVDRLRQCRSGDTAPTVVLVHGAWADASSWAGEVRMLQRAGVRVRAIANPVEDLTTDARYVADFLETVRGPIVLVGHSYGGAVITNAAAGVPGVKALIYVDASAPAPGETNAQLSGSRSVLTTGQQGKLYKTVPARRTHQAPRSCTCARPCSSKGSQRPAARPGRPALGVSARGIHRRVHDRFANGRLEDDHPSWFFVSTGDTIITPASQLAMARRARARVTTFRGGSHLTLISHPEAVAAVIASAICATTR